MQCLRLQRTSDLPESYDVFILGGNYVARIAVVQDMVVVRMMPEGRNPKVLFARVIDSTDRFRDRTRAFWLNKCCLAIMLEFPDDLFTDNLFSLE